MYSSSSTWASVRIRSACHLFPNASSKASLIIRPSFKMKKLRIGIRKKFSEYLRPACITFPSWGRIPTNASLWL